MPDLRARARPARGHPLALTRPRRPGADPAGDRPRQRQIRPGRAGQEVRDPRPRPLAADRRADADAEGQAQRGQREIRGPVRRAVCRLTCSRPLAANIGADAQRPTDNGGLFVGRRPGTAPVRFRALPQRGGERRQRVDGSLASLMLARSPCSACSAGGRSRSPACGSARRPTTSQAASASASWCRSPGCSRCCSARCRCCAASTGLDPRAPRRRPRSAHGRAGADLRGHRRGLRAGLRVLVPRHPRTWLEPRPRSAA